MIFFFWEKHIVKHKKIIANPEEQTTQINDFSVFLCMGRFRNLGSLKIFLG